MSDCEQSLRSLMSKERPWANRSGRSWQISDCEWFAQVAHDKWANEWFAQKIWLKSYFWYIFVRLKKKKCLLNPSFLMSDVSEMLRSLTKNEGCEQIAQVAHQKWAPMSDSLRPLTKNERPWANRSGGSPKMSKWVNCSFFSANRLFAHFFR